MTNGIAIWNYSPTKWSFDYWKDGTCTSGYQHSSNSFGLLFRDYFNGNLRESMWDEWSPRYKLAVPEQLVWWGEDDQEV